MKMLLSMIVGLIPLTLTPVSAAEPAYVSIFSCSNTQPCMTLQGTRTGTLVNKTLNLGGPGKLLVTLQGNLVCNAGSGAQIGLGADFRTSIGTTAGTLSQNAARDGTAAYKVTFEDILVSSYIHTWNMLTVPSSGMVPVVLNYSFGASQTGAFAKTTLPACKFYQGSVIGQFLPD